MAVRLLRMLFILVLFVTFANVHANITSDKLSENHNRLHYKLRKHFHRFKILSFPEFKNISSQNPQFQSQPVNGRDIVDGVEIGEHANTGNMSPNLMSFRHKVAMSNLHHAIKEKEMKQPGHVKTGVSDSMKTKFRPGMPAPSFSVPTLSGKLTYPGPVINQTSPIIFHSYNPSSGFLDCFWNCSGTMDDFIKDVTNDTHYIFMSNSRNAYANALWMRKKLLDEVEKLQRSSFQSQLHFVTLPLSELGNWIPQLLWEWSCPDHNCGLDQVRIESPNIQEKLKGPLVLKRLDARYDWLPSPESKFGDKTLDVVFVKDSSKGCKEVTEVVKGAVAMVPEGGCSYFQKIYNLQKAGSSAVLILQMDSVVVQDMTCVASECNIPLTIPAAMIPAHPLLTGQHLTVQFQNTPSENFFFGIDHQGSLSELGWLLFPSFRFLSWQAQWFGFKQNQRRHLVSQTDVLKINVFNRTLMKGKKGAKATVHLPDVKELAEYQTVELDASLSCPGHLDQDCPHWDHTVQLYICCNLSSPLCGMELGRWISPFRRRIGRWLTPVRSLLPLFTSNICQFTMKTAPWAMPWKPSLTLRFSNKSKQAEGTLYPFHIQPLYNTTFTFDLHYNSHFKTTTFDLPAGTEKVELVSVITGHGSDNNGCGEFCVTSHHFVVNGYTYNRTFATAGSPFGCAERVLEGVEPNEHGTWLYGRDGWCDGQQVTPWVIDISAKVKVFGSNVLSYYGWFNGTDPNPTANPGVMIFYSYLTFYKDLG